MGEQKKKNDKMELVNIKDKGIYLYIYMLTIIYLL
jgi:hypothetical protein